MASIFKKFWYLFFLFLCLILTGGVYAFNISNTVKNCNAILAKAETALSQQDYIYAGVYYQEFLDSCGSNDKIQRYLDFDKKELLIWLDVVDKINQAQESCAMGYFSGAISMMKDLERDKLASKFADSVRQTLAHCEEEKDGVYQARYYKATDSTAAYLTAQYFGVCHDTPYSEDLADVVIESTLAPKYWFPRIEEFSTTLQAEVPAAFRVAVCFDIENTNTLETCNYSQEGWQNTGVVAITITRKQADYRVILKDVADGSIIAEYPAILPGNTPSDCKERITTLNNVPTIPQQVILGEAQMTQEIIEWIEEQVRGIH